MLAHSNNSIAYAGTLAVDVQVKGTSLRALLGFIANELPHWRDRVNRPAATAEAKLTSDLAAHLNSAARFSEGWDMLQFRTEVPDEHRKERTIDLVPSPCGAIVWVNGRRYIDFDTLLPIECKRLPTPKGKYRDEREYVFSGKSTTGGIQRFKAGYHGGAHLMGAMIGYVQEEVAPIWFDRVSQWIEDLVRLGEAGWSRDDLIHPEPAIGKSDVSMYRSLHARENALPDIELLHLWVNMSP